jgi:hypothetical protein
MGLYEFVFKRPIPERYFDIQYFLRNLSRAQRPSVYEKGSKAEITDGRIHDPQERWVMRVGKKRTVINWVDKVERKINKRKSIRFDQTTHVPMTAQAPSSLQHGGFESVVFKVISWISPDDPLFNKVQRRKPIRRSGIIEKPQL